MTDVSCEWMMRIMELRKFPELATKEDVQKLTDDIILLIYGFKEKASYVDIVSHIQESHAQQP